jgi:hypothetical protein
MRSFRFSGVSASRLTVEGGIQRRFVERERDSSLQKTIYKQFSCPLHTTILHSKSCSHQSAGETSNQMGSLQWVCYCVYNSLLLLALRSMLMLFFRIQAHISSGLFPSCFTIKSEYALTYKCKCWKTWPSASVCGSWVENSDLCKNYYCYINWHLTLTHSHPYLTMDR